MFRTTNTSSAFYRGLSFSPITAVEKLPEMSLLSFEVVSLPLPTDYQAAVDFLKRNFSVEDIGAAPCKKLYILESPHIHELIYGRALCGNSGANFTRRLTSGSEDLPFGLYEWHVCPFTRHESLKGVGAINVCPFPMQAKPYGPGYKQFDEDIETVLASLTKIRERPAFDVPHRDDLTRPLKHFLLQDFAARLAGFIGSQSWLIPCGEVAEEFVAELEARGMLPAQFIRRPKELHPALWYSPP